MIITTSHTWIASSWTESDERTVYIEGDYIAVVLFEACAEFGGVYRATVADEADTEVAAASFDTAADARDWAEMFIDDARA